MQCAVFCPSTDSPDTTSQILKLSRFSGGKLTVLDSRARLALLTDGVVVSIKETVLLGYHSTRGIIGI